MSANVLAGLEIERCSDARDDLDWIGARLREPDATFVPVFRGRNLVARGGDSVELPTLGSADLPVELPAPEDAIFLGRLHGRATFAVALNEDQAGALSDRDREFRDLRWIVPVLDGTAAAVGAYARAICYWHYRHRYCGVCGGRTQLRSGGFRLTCGRCGKDHFPRVDPAIIVAVSHGERLLLGRQAAWDAGRYSTLAGFVEPGESLEDAVRREVAEESGIALARCDYHSSQPWPFPSSLMLGFLAEAAGVDIRVGEELEDAAWFTVEALRDGLASGRLRLPPHASISFRLIEHWLARTHGIALTEWKTDRGW